MSDFTSHYTDSLFDTNEYISNHNFYQLIDNERIVIMANRRKLKNRLLVLISEKQARENRRVLLSEIASTIGASNNTMTNWIRNEVQKYDTNMVERLCDYFDCDVSDLLYFENVKEDN